MRISAPGHNDCVIECPGPGYAHYIEPYGPCLTGCTEGGLIDSFIQVFAEGSGYQRASGRIFEVQGMTLAYIAEHFSPRFVGSGDTSRDIEWLTNLSEGSRKRRFDANWTNQDLGGVIRVLVEATSGRPRPRLNRA